MKRALIIYMLCLAASCSKGVVEEIVSPDNTVLGSDAIMFAAEIEEESEQSSEGRAALVNDAASMQSIGVYCASTGDVSWSIGTDFEKMYNTQLIYSSSSSSWEYASDDEMVTWGHSSMTDKYTFYAYSPYVDSSKTSISESTGALHITHNTSSEQSDLMVASPRKDIYPQVGGVVYLSFNHALCAISFSIINSGTQYSIVAARVKGVNDDAVMGWDENDAPAWSGHTITNGEFDIALSETSTGSGVWATTDNDYLIMLPQTLPSDVTFELDVTSGGVASTISYALNNTAKWESAKRYLYTATLDDGSSDDPLTFGEVKVSSWDVGTVTEDFVFGDDDE